MLKDAESRRDPHRWVVFGVISLIYFFVYFHRVSTSVIVSDLLLAFDTTAAALGLMSSMYFYVYAFNQPLVGYLADRMSPRRVIGIWTITAAAGCFLFAVAPSVGWACAGRALIGFGVGGVYVPTVKLLSQWFREKEFATMVGLLMSVGNFGAVVATTPLAWAAGAWGWRSTFVAIGIVSLGMAVLVLTFTRDHPGNDEDPTDREEAAVKPGGDGLRAILADSQFWLTTVMFFGTYGTAVTFQGLWATPYLMAALEIDPMQASRLNMLIPVGVIVGSPLFGWLPDRFDLDKAHLLRIITAIYICCWVALLPALGHWSQTGYGVLLLLMGLVIGGFISTIWGIIRQVTPARRLGLTSGFLNPAPFFGVAVFQVLTGEMIERAGRSAEQVPLSSFTAAFALCLAAAMVCLVVSFCIRSQPRPDRI